MYMRSMPFHFDIALNATLPGKPYEDLPGPILLDGLLQSFLLGTIVNQAFKYLMDYRDDSWKKRVFVIGVIGLSILQTILEDYKAWRTLILHRRWSTSRIEWSDLFLNGCICGLCEGFYIKRGWKMMGQNNLVLALLSCLSIIIMAANLYLAIAMGIAFHSLEATDDTLTASHFLLPSTIFAFSLWIFGSLVLEVAVSAILIISLWRSRTGFSEVDKIVLKVIHITWESAILPSVCMVIAVGLYHARPRRDDHLVLFFVLLTGKFYAFGMLRTLNSRAKLRMQSHELGRTSLNTWQWNQEPTVESRQSSFATIQVPPTAQGLIPLGTLDSLASKVEPSVPDTMPFSSSVQQSSPLAGIQETGGFRHRVCSAMGLPMGIEYNRGSSLSHIEP